MSRWHVCAQCGATVKGKKFCRTKDGRKPNDFRNWFFGWKLDEKSYFCSESCMNTYAVEHKADFIKTSAGRKILKEANAL